MIIKYHAGDKDYEIFSNANKMFFTNLFYHTVLLVVVCSVTKYFYELLQMNDKYYAVKNLQQCLIILQFILNHIILIKMAPKSSAFVKFCVFPLNIDENSSFFVWRISRIFSVLRTKIAFFCVASVFFVIL